MYVWTVSVAWNGVLLEVAARRAEDYCFLMLMEEIDFDFLDCLEVEGGAVYHRVLQENFSLL